MCALILPFAGKQPRIHKSAWLAPTATIIGDVEIGSDSSVFYGAVLRGDLNSIRIGARSNIQDNCVLHVDRDAECVLGDDVTVGHLALIHGARVGSGSLIGMKATLLSHSVIGAGCLVAAGAVVLGGVVVPEAAMVSGVPAKVKKMLTDAQSQGFIAHAGRYIQTAQSQATSALSRAEVAGE